MLRCFEVISDEMTPMYLPGPGCPAFEGGTATSYAALGDNDEPFQSAESYDKPDGDDDDANDYTNADERRLPSERCQIHRRRRAERGFVVKEISELSHTEFDGGKRGNFKSIHVRFRPHEGAAARACTEWSGEWRRVRVVRAEWHLKGAARREPGSRRCFRSYVVEHLDAPEGFAEKCAPEGDHDLKAIARIVALQGARERGVHPFPHLPKDMTSADSFRAGDLVEVAQSFLGDVSFSFRCCGFLFSTV